MAYSNKPMRRSALIGPWGVGAIVPFPNDESLMIAGLDMWRYNDAIPFIIKDERLQRRLGVQELRWPPDFREKNADPQNCFLKIPAVRFPTWHYCPFCGTMQKTTFYQQQPECDCYQWPNGRKCNPSFRHKRNLIANPVKALIESGYFFYNEKSQLFSVSPGLWGEIDSSGKSMITKICHQKLRDYYDD